MDWCRNGPWRLLCAAFAAVCLAAAAPIESGAEELPPNIILIVADDLGYGDLGVQGNPGVRTPNLDRLAADGARATSFYAAHAICAPSRAGLMTGRYQQRFGFEWNPGPRQEADPAFGIPSSERTIAERLRERGYATAAIGKWHLGYGEDQHPLARGFDYFYGFLGEAMAFTREGRGPQTLFRGREPTPMPAHTTEMFAEETVNFVERNRQRPFFVYLAFNAVHAPLQSTDAYLGRFGGEPDQRRRTYLAMLSAMDDAVGRVREAVERNGLSRRTLIVFTSDNGAPTWQTTGSNGALNGVKATLLEGGIRVPTIFYWPGVLRPGGVVRAPGIGQDISATVLRAGGAELDSSIDGVDFIPIIRRSARAPQRALFWRAGIHGAMREGDWKLVRMNDDWYLFNLRRDLGERHNLAAEQPRRLARMRARWEAWSATLSEPRFVMAQAQNPERLAGVQAMIRSYVETGEPGVDPRTLLYGGGPE